MSLLLHPEREDAYRVPPQPESLSWFSRVRYGSRIVWRHITKHVGVGIVCSVAYFDPGNWSVDLQAGSLFGYRPMLFVVLMAGLGAMVLQSLAFKLGCVTGLDLASHCRVLLHDRPRHRYLARYAVLYPLYVLSEIAIISTDLAELLGCAIGIVLIFPTIPLWAGVLMTASDVLIFLLIGDPSRGHGRPVRMFEYTIMTLVAAVFICFIILLVRVEPEWGEVFLGFIPSGELFKKTPNALYIAVGILGATVMPHALFLGSYLATQDRLSAAPVQPLVSTSDEPRGSLGRFRAWLRSLFTISRAERIAQSRDYRDKYGHNNNDLAFIKAHLPHGLADVFLSLLGVAVPINAAILVIAATVFHRDSSSQMVAAAGLFDAHQLIETFIGKAAAFIFALALLCAGQTASITATLAGQIVSEGFIEWRVSPFLRRLITRLIGLVPSVTVAIAVGRPGIDTLLVASQVALAIVLPFVAAPLIWLTSSRSVMSVSSAAPSERGTSPSDGTAADPADAGATMDPELLCVPRPDAIEPVQAPRREPGPGACDAVGDEKDGTGADKQGCGVDVEDAAADARVSYASSPAVTALAVLVFIVILAANMYAIVMLAMGKTA